MSQGRTVHAAWRNSICSCRAPLQQYRLERGCHCHIENIKAGDYVDFLELPPAKGKGRAFSQDWDPWILLLQVQQTENPHRLIPDFPTWA